MEQEKHSLFVLENLLYGNLEGISEKFKIMIFSKIKLLVGF